jgi:hypothetical protein
MNATTDIRYAQLEFELGKLGLESVKDLEVMRLGYDYAFNNELMEEYKANLWANQYCAEDIDAALVQFPDNPQQAYNKVAKIYGNERVATVLNISIEARNLMPSFESFSQEINEWGERYKITGASAPKSLLPLESDKRPPLLLTDTVILEKFTEIVRANEIPFEHKKTKELMNLQEPLIIQNDVTLSEANSGVGLDSSGNLTAINEFNSPIIADKKPQTGIIVPPKEEIVKVIAIKEIIAKMPTPEMLRMVEQVLMYKDIDELQQVYPHAFENAEPDRSEKAVKIIEELENRQPITIDEFPQIFDEVLVQKTAEPRPEYLSGLDEITVITQTELDNIHPDFAGKITVCGGMDAEPITVRNMTVHVEGVSFVTAFDSTIFAHDEAVVTGMSCWIEANDYAHIFSYDCEVTLNDSATVSGEVVNLIDNRKTEIKERETSKMPENLSHRKHAEGGLEATLKNYGDLANKREAARQAKSKQKSHDDLSV